MKELILEKIGTGFNIGETKTFEVEDKKIEITVVIINDNNEVRLLINGIITPFMNEDSFFKYNNIDIKIKF
jgi:hypothetical protein